MKILVVCYSYSGNTAALAEAIRRETGGDLLRVEPAEKYPDDYSALVETVKREISSGRRPPLKPGAAGISAYGVIFAGSPNWCGTIAPPLASFLASHDLSGKSVVPFCTHGGGGAANCFSDIARLCPGAKVREGMVFPGDRAGQAEIPSWLERLGLKRPLI